MDQYIFIIIIKGMYALSGVGVNGPVYMDLMDQARELQHQVQYTLYDTELYYVVWYCTVLRCIILYYSATVLYLCTVLNYIVLRYILL